MLSKQLIKMRPSKRFLLFRLGNEKLICKNDQTVISSDANNIISSYYIAKILSISHQNMWNVLNIKMKKNKGHYNINELQMAYIFYSSHHSFAALLYFLRCI